MKSETFSIQNIFQDRRQYCVPFYQRAYVWTLEEQWEQLWDDIREKAEVRLSKVKITPHFLGAVVLDPQEREGLMGVDVLHIIDGQQRLTTLQFVLKAVMLVLGEKSSPELGNAVMPCMRNGNTDTMRNPSVEVFKLWPTFRDRDNYRSAMDAPNLADFQSRFAPHFTNAGELRKIGMDHPPALAAIWFFSRWIRRWLDEQPSERASRLEALVLAILKDLKVVCITLDKEDDAQIIFETLNGRGAQLLATDLIRNYLFMRADREDADSQELYDTLWAPFESSYWSTPQRRGRLNKPRLEWLIHASLQAELHDEVEFARLYFEFRRFATSGNLDARGQLRKLSEYATFYRELIGGGGDGPVSAFGRRVVAFDIATVHPLALMIAAAPMQLEQKREMYRDIWSYLVRRAICGLTQKSYNNIFLAVLRHVGTVGLTPESLRGYLKGLVGDASRWPDDAEFRNACLTGTLYYGRLETPKMRMVLTELEAQLRSATRVEERNLPELANLDIDHIMPRSWHAYWPLADGSLVKQTEIADVDSLVRIGEPLNERQAAIAKRQAAISTLGNLSLLNLSVNREAQNYEYKNKRDLLIANTSLRLNVPLISKDSWDEDSIAKRGETLFAAALEVWPRP